MFEVEAYGGLVPPIVVAFSGPALVVYGDGRVIQFVNEKRPYVSPPAYLVATVSPLAVAEFAVEAEAGNVINEHTDFGMPEVTDLPFTTVWLRGANGEQKVQIYGFDDTFNKDVSVRQPRNRRRLAELIDRAYALPGDTAGDPFQPERVRVLELDPTSYSEATDVPPWPGPDPDTFLSTIDRGYPGIACGLLSGDEAAVIYAAVRDNAGVAWMVDGRQRLLPVLPLLPSSTIDCPR